MPTPTFQNRIKLPATTYLACLEIIKSGLSSHSHFRMLNTTRIIMNWEEGVTRPNEPRHYPYFVVAEDKPDQKGCCIYLVEESLFYCDVFLKKEEWVKNVWHLQELLHFSEQARG